MPLEGNRTQVWTPSRSDPVRWFEQGPLGRACKCKFKPPTLVRSRLAVLTISKGGATLVMGPNPPPAIHNSPQPRLSTSCLRLGYPLFVEVLLAGLLGSLEPTRDSEFPYDHGDRPELERA